MLKIKSSLIPAILLIAVFCISSTTEDSNSNAGFIKKILAYQTVYRQEITYLHTDKPVYLTGETIWFSSYIINAKNNKLNETEIVMYVDLLRPNGGVIQKKILKVTNGRATGQIDIPEPYKSGEYTLVAYTNWMRNTGADFYYRKPIYILNDSPEKVKNEYSVEDTISDILKDMNIRGNKAETSDALSETEMPEEKEPGLQMAFYPEGGDLVSGITNKVAFEAKDSSGLNIAVSGFVKDNTGNVVSTIQTLWKGRGFFMFTPDITKTYYAEINTSNNEQTLKFPLPQILASGYNLKVESSSQSSDILVTLSNSTGKTENVFLLAMQNTSPVYALADTLFQKSKTYAIPKTDLNTGIIQFTLFDKNKRPMCERLFFLNKNDQLQISIDKTNFEPEKRDKISIELYAQDKEGYPAIGTFSLAITDAERISDKMYSEPDFVSNFYLTSMLPGLPADLKTILKPGSKNYLKSELLMLTNGWRRYTWDKVLQDTISIPEYLEEPGLYVKGKLFRNTNKKKEVPAGMDVTLFFPKKFDAYAQLTDNNGEFSFILKDFYDTLGAVIQTKNKMSLKKDFMIEMETNNKSRPVDFFVSNPYEIKGENLSDVYTKELKRNTLEKELEKAVDNQLYLDTTDVIIDEVTVIGSKGKDFKSAMVDEFGAPEQSVGKKQLNDLNEQKPWNWGLVSIIEDAIPGLEVLIQSDTSVKFTPKDRKRHRFFIFVDGELVGSTDANGLLTQMHRLYQVEDLIILDPTIVNSIDLIYPQDDRPGDALKAIAEFYEYEMSDDDSNVSDLEGLITQSENFITPVAILSIYTENGGGLYSQVHYKGILNLKITGYSKTKEFYSPDYSDPDTKIETDERTTLYWNPTVTTDEFGKATIEFYNSDIGHKFRADVVGLSTDGVPGDARLKFGSDKSLAPPVLAQQEEAEENDVIFYENPEDIPVVEEEPEPVWVNPTKIKVHVNQPNNEPAVFADITVLSRKWGNVTDEDGNFYLDMALIRDYDTVIISYKGEAEKILIASDMSEDDTKITLEPLTLTQTSEDGSEIARQAIKSILKTRSRKMEYGLSAYREETGWNDQMQSLLDLNLVTRVPGILDNSIVYSSRILKGQWFKTDNYDSNVDFTPKVNSIFSVQIMDPAYNASTFLKLQYRKNYDFVMEGKTMYMNKPVYKISFDQTESAPWSLQKGYMLVEQKTFAILFVEWKASPKGARYIVPDQYLMGGTKFNDFKLLSDNNMATFNDDANGLVLKSGRQDVSFELNHNVCFYSRELVVNEYFEKLPFKFFPNTMNNLDKRFVLIKKPVYNPRKWRVPWFLSVNSSISEQIPYMHEVLLLTDPDTKLDLLNIDF